MTVIPVLWIGYSKLEVLCLHPSSIAFSLAVSSPGPAIQYIPDQTKRIQKFVRDAAPSLFFWIGDPKQNVNSFMTPFSDSLFYALSQGSLSFAFHGSFSTILWLVKILQQPIRIFAMEVDRAAMENETETTMWKSIENWIRKQTVTRWGPLFGAVSAQKKP